MSNLKQYDASDRKRLFLDIETSQMLVWVWGLNDKANQHISHLNIEREPEIICIAWKWAGKEKVESLTWDENQSSKKMLEEFVPILESADEIVAHNGNRFDIKWIRGRCLMHQIPMSPKVPSVDTLVEARAKFRLSSNRLDYLMRKAGLGVGKKKVGIELWRAIQTNNCPKALKKMVQYCKFDVSGLEAVYNWMAPYIEPKTSVAQYRGDCPECGSSRMGPHNYRTMASGSVKVQIRCYDCGKNQLMTLSAFKGQKEIQRD
jgi:uncharacterized protein YprB with RNaseH-like and TPR domain